MTTQTSSVPVVQLRNIGKTYRTGPVEVAAVRDVTLNIDPGEFVAVMGASGSGKSTLMNMLGCLDRPTSGSYLLDGVAVGKLNRKELATLRNQKLGFVFQNFNFLARTSALENVELPMFYSYPTRLLACSSATRHASAGESGPRERASGITLANYPAANSNASRLPALLSTAGTGACR